MKWLQRPPFALIARNKSEIRVSYFKLNKYLSNWDIKVARAYYRLPHISWKNMVVILPHSFSSKSKKKKKSIDFRESILFKNQWLRVLTIVICQVTEHPVTSDSSDSYLFFLSTALPGTGGKELPRATILLHRFSFLVQNSLPCLHRGKNMARDRGDGLEFNNCT